VRCGTPAANRALSAFLGRNVTLWPRLAPGDEEHYRRVWPEDALGHLLMLFGVEDAADLPDMTVLPPEVVRSQTIPGTYFDAYPIHVVSTGELAELGEVSSREVDVRRFRPNLVVDGRADASWAGRRMRIGSAVLRVVGPCPRCIVITLPHQGLPTDRETLRDVHRSFQHQIGLYATVEIPGAAGEGDVGEVLDG
jgi:uncharacterized protein YcbX